LRNKAYLKYLSWVPTGSAVILAAQEAEIRRIMVWSQPGQIVCETLFWKNPWQERAGGVAWGVGLEFKLQHHTHTKKIFKMILKFLLVKMWFVKIFAVYQPNEIKVLFHPRDVSENEKAEVYFLPHFKEYCPNAS
jgi:hypothetical protein